MEDKVLNTYHNTNNETLKLVNDALQITGESVLEVSTIGNKLEYDANLQSVYKPNVHIGERLLFINGLNFLNMMVKYSSVEGKKSFVVFAGGAPGYYLYELSRYYPNVIFLVIDPKAFSPYISDNLIQPYNEYVRLRSDELSSQQLTKIHYLRSLDTLARLLDTSIRIFALRRKCTPELLVELKFILLDTMIYFWSNKFEQESKNEEPAPLNDDEPEYTDYDIIKNMITQYNYIKHLQPDASMLRFRIPIYDIGPKRLGQFMETLNANQELDILNNYMKKKIIYPNGKLILQPWNTKSSTETRIIIKKENIFTLAEYDIAEYDALMNYYNCLERPVRKHNNDEGFYKYGYCECNDCAIELAVFKEYLTNNREYAKKEFSINGSIYELVGNLSQRLNYLLGTKLEIPGIHGVNRF